MNDLIKIKNAKTRSVSAENFTGEKSKEPTEWAKQLPKSWASAGKYLLP